MFSSRLHSFVLDNYTHTFSFIMSTVKGNMMRIIRAVYFILVLITFVFVSIDVYFYSFFFSPVVTFGQPAHICALQTSHKVDALQFESPEDQLVRDEKKGVAVELLQEQSDHSSNNPLLVPDHSESNHVLRDSEFQGSSQDRMQFDSFLSARAFIVSVHNMKGEILKQQK